jgi:hypothetical protein
LSQRELDHTGPLGNARYYTHHEREIRPDALCSPHNPYCDKAGYTESESPAWSEEIVMKTLLRGILLVAMIALVSTVMAQDSIVLVPHGRGIRH